MNPISKPGKNKLFSLSVEHRQILEYSDQGFVSRDEPLAVESLLTLFIQDQPFQHMLYLPGKEKELALGFLLTSGVIESLEDIASFEFLPESPPLRPNQVKIQLAREMGPAKIPDNHGALAQAVLHGQAEASRSLTAAAFSSTDCPPLRIKAAQLQTLVEKLPEQQLLYRQTRATHAILLADATSGEIIFGAEDVGRHNAFDKVIGKALLEHIVLADKVIILSGRSSFEMVLKAARAGLPLIAAVSAPTLLAVKLAECQGITLAASIRENKMKIYAHPERLIDL
jgi:FdhD protein